MSFASGRMKLVVLSTVFILLIASGGGVVFQMLEAQKTGEVRVSVDAPWKKIQTTLQIQVYDSNGVLRDSVVKKDDLVLNNFRIFLCGVFVPVYNQNSKTVSLKDTTNAARVIHTRSTSTTYSTNTYSDSSSGTAAKGGVIGIGIGSTAPTVSDYNLENQVESYTAITSGYPTWTSATGNVTITATIPITATRTITEAALGCVWIPSTGVIEYTFIHFRDTFAGVVVHNLDTCVITYFIELTSVEFSDNFGRFLAALFTTVADGGYVSASLKDQLGNTDTIYIYYPTFYESSLTITLWPSSATVSGARVGIGTANTAPARTHANLIAAVETMTAPAPIPAISGATVTIIADVLCTSARDVVEAAFFLGGTTTTDTYMFWRDTFTLVAIPAGNSIRVVFTISL